MRFQEGTVVRTATAAIVTSVATFAIGGMLAFCRADDPLMADRNETVDKTAVANSAEPTKPAPDSGDETSRPPVRRWGDPEPEALPQASAVAAELAAIRERVGTAVPEDWQAFGVSEAAVEGAGFEKKIEALEAEEAPPEWRSDLTVPVPIEFGAEEAASRGLRAAAVPPTLADADTGADRGIPFKPSQFEPYPGGWEMGPGPSPYLPPNAEILPFESPEALGELTKLLSATARDLERMAHVREEQRRYEDADRLRRLAMQLRRENRRLLPEPTPNPAYPGSSVGRR